MTTKKSDKSNDQKKSDWQENFKQTGAELKSLFKDAKTKYDKVDDKTKKKVIVALAGAVALLAGAFGLKKARDKWHKKEK